MFDLNDPRDLHKIILSVYDEYMDNPTERDFIFLVLGFSHLREWICHSKHSDIVKKKNDGIPLSSEEKFFDEIYTIPEFQVVKALCNSAKHRVSRGELPTSKIEGFRTGLGKTGDKLNQLYFLIDGKDSRDYFNKCVQKYNDWFSSCD